MSAKAREHTEPSEPFLLLTTHEPTQRPPLTLERHGISPCRTAGPVDFPLATGAPAVRLFIYL